METSPTPPNSPHNEQADLAVVGVAELGLPFFIGVEVVVGSHTCIPRLVIPAEKEQRQKLMLQFLGSNQVQPRFVPDGGEMALCTLYLGNGIS